MLPRPVRRVSLALIALAGLAGPLHAAPVFTAAGYEASISFAAPTLPFAPLAFTTPTALAWTAGHYVSGSGGGVVPFQILDNHGALVGNSATALDTRSLFTDAAGRLYARAAGSSVILRESAPGVLAPFVTLAGAAPDYQSGVVLNGAGTEFIAQYAGTLQRWALDGSALGSVTLAGFGAAGENDHAQRRSLAALGDLYLTFNSTNRTLSAWDATGARLDTTVLRGAGGGLAAGFSLSIADGRVFVAGDDGLWRGFDVGLLPVTAIPEPSSLALLAAALLLLSSLPLRIARNVR